MSDSAKWFGDKTAINFIAIVLKVSRIYREFLLVDGSDIIVRIVGMSRFEWMTVIAWEDIYLSTSSEDSDLSDNFYRMSVLTITFWENSKRWKKLVKFCNGHWKFKPTFQIPKSRYIFFNCIFFLNFLLGNLINHVEQRTLIQLSISPQKQEEGEKINTSSAQWKIKSVSHCSKPFNEFSENRLLFAWLRGWILLNPKMKFFRREAEVTINRIEKLYKFVILPSSISIARIFLEICFLLLENSKRAANEKKNRKNAGRGNVWVNDALGLIVVDVKKVKYSRVRRKSFTS